MYRLLILLLLFGCAPKLDPGQKGKIKPGVGVEGVSLGMQPADAVKALGKPEEEFKDNLAPDSVYWLYYGKGLELTFTKGKLDYIVCHGQEDKWMPYPGATAEGISTASTRKDCEAALGAPLSKTNRALEYKGLTLRLTPEEKVESIAVKVP